MLYSGTLKPLIIYIIIIFVLAFLLNIFIQSYSKANFSEQKKEELLSSVSKFSYFTENPCTNFISGDPDVKEDYVKIHIHCGGQVSSNTLAIKAVHPPTYLGLINLIGRINLFETEASQSGIKKMGGSVSDEKAAWHCFMNKNEIMDFGKNIEKKDNIDCFYQ